MENREQNAGSMGSGAADQTGSRRGEQVNPSSTVYRDERKDIAEDAGISRKDVADLEDLGAMSGRDDYAGGSGDRMEDESTGDATER